MPVNKNVTPLATDAKSCAGAHHAASRIIPAAVMWLTALSLALATPVAARPSRDGIDGVGDSVPQSHNVQSPTAKPPSSGSATSGTPLAGHDKCKIPIGNLPYPPWCTDSSGGWMESTLHRGDASYLTRSVANQPTMPIALPLIRAQFNNSAGEEPSTIFQAK